MKKSIKTPAGRSKLKTSIITSALVLALAAISFVIASVYGFQFPSPATWDTPAQFFNNATGTGGLGLGSVSFNLESLEEIGEYLDLAYMFGGMGVGVLLSLMYTDLLRGESGVIAGYRRKFYSYIRSRTADYGEAAEENTGQFQREVSAKKLRLYIAFPVLCIAIAELLIFLGKVEAAILVHIGLLLALSLSNILLEDPEIHQIYMPLMLLPVLRLINLSMPVFFKTTLYLFVFIYTPLAIPAASIVMHYRNSPEEFGITKKHLLTYLVLAVPLSFLLGLGEYLIIRPGYLVPDLTLENLLKLSIVMIFFVGLVEELIFRSIIQTRLEQMLSLPEALLITSFLFGLMHSGYGTYYEMLFTGFVGLIIGLIYYKTRSLPFIAFLHGLINIFLFGILPLHLIGWTWPF